MGLSIDSAIGLSIVPTDVNGCLWDCRMCPPTMATGVYETAQLPTHRHGYLGDFPLCPPMATDVRGTVHDPFRCPRVSIRLSIGSVMGLHCAHPWPWMSRGLSLVPNDGHGCLWDRPLIVPWDYIAPIDGYECLGLSIVPTDVDGCLWDCRFCQPMPTDIYRAAHRRPSADAR